MALTYDQVLSVWRQATDHSGNPVSVLDDNMAAIAMAESSGRADVVNSIGATGLCQILWWVWCKDPDVRKIAPTQDALKDPLTNAKVAAIVYKKQGYTAWDVYKNGSYKQYSKGGVNLESPSAVGKKAVSTVADPIYNAVQKALLDAWVDTQPFMAKALFVVAGGALGVYGIIQLGKSSKGGSE